MEEFDCEERCPRKNVLSRWTRSQLRVNFIARMFFRERQLRFAPDAWRPAPLTAPDLEQPESTLLLAAAGQTTERALEKLRRK